MCSILCRILRSSFLRFKKESAHFMNKILGWKKKILLQVCVSLLSALKTEKEKELLLVFFLHSRESFFIPLHARTHARKTTAQREKKGLPSTARQREKKRRIKTILSFIFLCKGEKKRENVDGGGHLHVWRKRREREKNFCDTLKHCCTPFSPHERKREKEF